MCARIMRSMSRGLPRVTFFLWSFVNVLIHFQYAIAVPQIFTESYKFCTFEFNQKNITFPDKLWTVSTREFVLQFSLCKPVQGSCRNQSFSCAIQKRNREEIDLGHGFVVGDDDDDFTLTSSKGAPCRSDPSRTYTLSISLQCFQATKSQPALMPSDEDDHCAFEVVMMRPDCRPRCTESIANSHFVDMRSFRRNFQVRTETKNFSLTLCGSNQQCNKGTSSCELLNSESVPLASLESQHLVYDAGKNELTARGRYKQGRIVRDVQVLIKCNWYTDLSNAKYKKIHIQGRHYKFEVDSSFGCIKLPHNCIVSSMDNLHYDLSSLYRAQGWEVSGVPTGRIFVSICGPLKRLQGVCLDQYSQVCQIGDSYINRGSILLPLQATDDVIRATFVSGSTCAEDPQSLYSTRVEFECSKKETGPVFKETKNCTMYLVWKTPRACPIDYYKSSTCYVNDRISQRDLRKLHTATDQTYSLSPSSGTRLVYNLCGPIHVPCGQFKNVSFCLKSGQDDLVLGWESRDLISENGQLRMELSGSVCRRGSPAAVNVHFVCSYESRPSPPHIIVIEDGCRYNLTISTSLACTWPRSFHDCTLSTANFEYDLTALSLRNSNYVVSVHDIDYVFNLCGSVITRPGVLCRGDTMVCQRNRSEANVKHRYKSLGSIGGPLVVNDTLVVVAKMGALCANVEHYKSVIFLECSDRGFAPEFVSKTDCTYSFKWRTPEACPRQKKCLIPGTKPEIGLDLTNLQRRTIPVLVENGTNQYEFHLCADSYIVTSNGTKNTHNLTRRYVPYDKKSYVLLDMERSCDEDTDFTKVFLHLQCAEKSVDLFEQTSYEHCVLNVTLKTPVVCALKKEHYVYSIIETQETTTPRKEVVKAAVHKNCSINNSFTGYEFDLRKAKSQKIQFNNTDMVVNFDGQVAECGGIFCRNSSEMVPSVCPTSFFNYSHHLVVLKYTGFGECENNQPYEFEVLMKCNQTKNDGRILEDNECKSVITYDSPEACFLLQENIPAANATTGIVAGVVTAVLLIVICIIVVFINRRRCAHYLQYMPFHRAKTAVPIYTRDSTL